MSGEEINMYEYDNILSWLAMNFKGTDCASTEYARS